MKTTDNTVVEFDFNQDHDHLQLGEIDAVGIEASEKVEEVLAEYRELKQDIDALNEKLQEYREKICIYMEDAEVLVGNGGEILATWKRTKPIKRFNQSFFKDVEPNLYNEYCEELEGQRRFIVIK